MKTIIFLEGASLVGCFMAAILIAVLRTNIKIASLSLYGLLVCWFVLFYVAVPYLHFRMTNDEAVWKSFADAPRGSFLPRCRGILFYGFRWNLHIVSLFLPKGETNH